MLNIQPTTKREIDEFLKEDLSKRGNVDSVILCGSQATGNATERSDIDLCYIGEMTAFSRESLFYGSREFQLMMAPWSWYHHVVSEYERKGNNGTITVMLAKGHCLRGCTDAWRDLRQWWATKTKYQLEEIRSRDGTMANLVETCLDSLECNEHALYELCSHVLTPVGGWMKEPWRAQ